MRRHSLAWVVAFGFAALSSIAFAESSATGEPSAKAKQFMKEAAVGGLTEVALGKLAQENGASPAVKQFGQRMVTDHSKANRELESLAKKQDVTLPQHLDAKHEAVRDRLAKLSGKAFDEAYMNEMTSDHRQDVEDFKTASQSLDDPAVQSFAKRTLPVLEAHLKKADEVKASL